jgi:hypothetical protein
MSMLEDPAEEPADDVAEEGDHEEDAAADDEQDADDEVAADPWEVAPVDAEDDEPEVELAERGGIFKRRRR